MIRLFSPSESFSAPSPLTCTVYSMASVMMVSFQRSNASPSESNPGPRLADVAGTLMVMCILALKHKGHEGTKVERLMSEKLFHRFSFAYFVSVVVK